MYFIIAVSVYLIGLLLSRIIKEKAYKYVSTEEKGKLIELFSKSRIVVTGIIVVFAGALYGLLYLKIVPLLMFNLLLVIGIVLIILFNSIYFVRVHKNNSIPKKYTILSLVATSVATLAILLFILFLTIGINT